MKRFTPLLLVFALLSGSAPQSASAASRAGVAPVSSDKPPKGYVPRSWPLSPHGPILPANGALFGAHIGIDPVWTGPDRRTAQANVEASVGRKLVLDRQYYFFDDQFPTVDDYWSRDQGRTLILSMSAYNRDGSINYWADIANGVYDATLNARAADIKAFGAPLFFTFHHEPNKGHGFVPGTPTDFQNAWRHIHDLFVADGVTNVSWTLILMAWTYKNNKAGKYYPGTRYVDVLAADGYNWFGCNQPSGPWLEVTDIFSDFYNYGVQKGKPMMVAEWGTGEDPADPTRKADWFTNGLATFKSWPQIKAVSYYDSTHGHSDCPRWINTSQNSIDAFTSIGADPWFNPTPMITITSGPTDPSANGNATFTWTSTLGQGTSVSFTCSLDGGAASACSSPTTYTNLAVGAHVFSVTPTDNTGIVGNPSNWPWTVTGPVTTITSGPADPTPSTSATFTFQGDKPGYTFTCSMDAGTGTACASPTTYTGLSTGAHTFSVTASDGNRTGLPATWSWTISAIGAISSALDNYFSPSDVSITQGQAVQWNFAGLANHTATDATGLGLYDSGSLPSGSVYAFSFIGAGVYAFKCTLHPSTMTGSVTIPMTAAPLTGTQTTTFTLTWSSNPPPAGFGFQVQILRPGQTWKNWGQVKTTASDTFVPDGGIGTYQFEARLINIGTGAGAAYSPPVSITVTS